MQVDFGPRAIGRGQCDFRQSAGAPDGHDILFGLHLAATPDQTMGTSCADRTHAGPTLAPPAGGMPAGTRWVRATASYNFAWPRTPCGASYPPSDPRNERCAARRLPCPPWRNGVESHRPAHGAHRPAADRAWPTRCTPARRPPARADVRRRLHEPAATRRADLRARRLRRQRAPRWRPRRVELRRLRGIAHLRNRRRPPGLENLPGRLPRRRVGRRCRRRAPTA